MVPKVLLEFNPLAPATNDVFGMPRLVWLSKLNASPRSWRLACSARRMFLMIEKSRLKNPGLLTSGRVRPMVP